MLPRIIPVEPIILFVGFLFDSCTYKFTKSLTDTDTISCVDSILSLDSNTWKDYHDSSKDSFIVKYRQKVHGYKVRAVLRPYESDFMVLAADIYFTKNGKTFMLHSNDFGDTIFCKGRLDMEHENSKTFEKYCYKTVKADYKKGSKNGVFFMYTPFFFQDMDFDGIPELVIVHQSEAVRFHDGYDVYRIVEGIPILIDYPPYYNKGNNDFGMTDYLQFDFKKKTITCPFPEGEIRYEGYTIYGLSKKKDIVIVNGRKHYFNKIIKYKNL